MSAEQLIQYVSWAIYLVLFASVLVEAVRRPMRANLDIALLFGASTLIIIVTVAVGIGLLASDQVETTVTSGLLIALPYLLLRLVDDFSDVPPWLMRLAAGGLVLLVVAFGLLPPTLSGWFILPALVYMIGLLIYNIVAFGRESRQAGGVTRRRMQAVALGSVCLCADFVFDGLGVGLPTLRGLWSPLADLAGLASGIFYFLGFAPPGLLRRAWQEPELRAFLGRAARLPRLPDTAAILREMERGAATSVGAPHAAIGLWDEAAQVLRFVVNEQEVIVNLADATVAGQVFHTQQPFFTDNVQRDNPATAASSRSYGARAVLAAPITAGDKRLGVLSVYAPRTSIFADEDLSLVQLLADQASVVLESRALIDEAARVQAREEVTRLKEDFLSAAAHDLKTPLTTLVAQAQLLERRATRNPAAPADLPSIQRMVKETNRLRTLVLELLDAARAEQGRLVGERAEVDLTELAQETCARHTSPRHPCAVEATGPVVGQYDPNRMLQLIENLVENSVKYSPEGGPVRVHAWREDGWNHVTVSDTGIGIPPADLAHIFERFHRGKNVDDRRFAGMGLGLFICRGIAEQHGGRITVQSRPQQGTTFHVALPVAAPDQGREPADHA